MSASQTISPEPNGPVEAGRLDQTCAQLLGVECGVEIWLSDDTLTKLRLRHGEINFSHYRHMPSILLLGFLARGRHPNLLELWWLDRSGPVPLTYFVVLKTTRHGEVFVRTFHLAHQKEARRLRNKARRDGRLVREQVGS
jgi:hypothetical protein